MNTRCVCARACLCTHNKFTRKLIYPPHQSVEPGSLSLSIHLRLAPHTLVYTAASHSLCKFAIRILPNEVCILRCTVVHLGYHHHQHRLPPPSLRVRIANLTPPPPPPHSAPLGRLRYVIEFTTSESNYELANQLDWRAQTFPSTLFMCCPIYKHAHTTHKHIAYIWSA